MTDPNEEAPLQIKIDRGSKVGIGEQIYAGLRGAILSGVLSSGARLPSGRDLAIQLGVSRGTIRSTYDRLAAENLVSGAGSAGTRVNLELPGAPLEHNDPLDAPLAVFTRPYSRHPLPFQVGVPANDAFPAKTWSRLRSQAVRADGLGFTTYADPRGEPELRSQIARHLAVSRQVQCHPDQIIVTSGYRQGILLALTAMRATGKKAWYENPGYPIGRKALEILGVARQPVTVDEEGLCVAEGIRLAPDAVVALVSPGQQAPLGMTLSPARRQALLSWAEANGSWVIEDDYLGELQIDGRAAPALASGVGAERVVHIGVLSKTMSPALGLGYVVAPRALTERIVEVAAFLAPAPNRTTQLALAKFLADGHFLRHLRQMKTLYAERRNTVLARLSHSLSNIEPAGLNLIVHLAKGVDDIALARDARDRGLAPAALSSWYVDKDHARSGLLLSTTNIREDNLRPSCSAIVELIRMTVGRVAPIEPH